jgi:cAMP phosphodiesterase
MWQLNTAIDVILNHCFASMIWPMSFVLLSLVSFSGVIDVGVIRLGVYLALASPSAD